MKPYHQEIKILNTEENVKIFESLRFGHLACHVKDDIYLIPITYIFEDGYIYSHSRMGKKIEMMRRNPKVCVQVEDVEDFFKWRSVLAWGYYEELKGDAALVAMRNFLKKILEKETETRRSELEVDFSVLLESSIVFRIKVEKTTGRSEGVSTW